MMHSDYETNWAEYRLKDDAFADGATSGGTGGTGNSGGVAAPASGDGGFKAVIEAARQMVSKAAGVPLDAVKITIGFGPDRAIERR